MITPLILISKLWFLVLFMLNPRLIYIGLGIVVGGVATLESEFVLDRMVMLQGIYHEIATSVFETGNEYVPSLNEDSVEQLLQDAQTTTLNEPVQ
jgi:hypothetical protein